MLRAIKPNRPFGPENTMTTKLTQTHKKHLSMWIDPSTSHVFSLRYKITRDGCDAKTFHLHCDNKGPTVTVLYNTNKSVYGGYTAVNWANNQYANDSQGFLFKLENNGIEQPMKFPFETDATPMRSAYEAPFGRHAILNTAVYGPTFGSGHDLVCFQGTVKQNGNYFPLNGSVNLGHSYDMKGQDFNSVMNGHLNITELEVYNVREKTIEEQREEALLAKRNELLLEKPWIQNFDWSSKLEESMKKEVATYKPLPGLDLQQANILLVGQVGAGKSSYFNTINAIFRGRISVQANSGSAEKSLTTAFRMYKVRDGYAGKPLNFRLCDNRGLEEGHGLSSMEVGYLLDGHVPEKYKFTKDIPLAPDTIGFVKNPTFSDQIHCVAFVIDASSVDVMPVKVIEHIKTIQAHVIQRGIPQAVLLTNIDRICQEVCDDVSQVFHSKAVKQCVGNVSAKMGLPETQIMPVKNYHREVHLDQNINILALLSLTRIFNFVDDSLYNKLDELEVSKGDQKRKE